MASSSSLNEDVEEQVVDPWVLPRRRAKRGRREWWAWWWEWGCSALTAGRHLGEDDMDCRLSNVVLTMLLQTPLFRYCGMKREKEREERRGSKGQIVFNPQPFPSRSSSTASDFANE